jgi:hypothetical protein
MGMPTQFLQPQNPMQTGAPIHSNTTMGMPMPPQNGQMPYLAESAPMTPGMVYAPAPFQVPFPQNQVYHSSSTMAMPTMTEAEARARLMAAQAQGMPGVMDPFAALRAAANPPDMGAPRTSKKGSKKAAKVAEEEEEVNLLAVIVFGSLSVTALGGLGMLILLWITSV